MTDADPADLLRRQLLALRDAGVTSAELSPEGQLLRVSMAPALPPAPPHRDPPPPITSPVPHRPGAPVTVQERKR